MAAAAHDVRNPIAVIRASAQMAQRQIARGDASNAEHRLAAIVEQTDRVTDMLETFLDAARISAGHVPLRRERVDLREAVNAAVERARAMLGEPSERPIDVDVADGYVGEWDRSRLVRALRALLSNALMYGNASQPVRVQATRTPANRVHLVVSGGGRGPDDEERLHLFERFYRGRTAADAGQSGSGLGLFTARGIARLHGGDVRQLEGDTFEIELPLS